MFPAHPSFRPLAGPSTFVRSYASAPPPPPPELPSQPPSRPVRFHPGQNPTIPLQEDLTAPRSADQAEKYFRRIAGNPDTRLPSWGMRWLGVGGWVVGAVASTYMVLYADFGNHEHVFSPIRRHFHAYTASMFQLSQHERNFLGLDDPIRRDGVRVAGAGAGTDRPLVADDTRETITPGKVV